MDYKNMTHRKTRVALIHDWLPLIGGAERVLQELTHIFPQADIFTLFDFLTPQQKEMFNAKNIYSSYLNKLPYVKKYYRHLLGCCPQAIESFDLTEYDLVFSSSASVAKGVITRPNQVHIAYVHSPARYAWDLTHQYLKQGNLDKGIKGYLAQRLLHKFRIWDMRTANGVDHFISNSDYIAKRIYKTYRREAHTIYPPINIEFFEFRDTKEDFYLTASRFVPYKRVDLIASAFAKMPDKKLVIIGDGPDYDIVKMICDKAPNITMLGYQETSVLKDYMQRSRAFIFAAEEDFGIIPLEAQACGTPVIAYGAGGALETVIGIDNNPDTGTGIFFDTQTEDSLVEAVKRFDSYYSTKIHQSCRDNAEKFSVATFRDNIRSFINQVAPELEI
jgi:glycosyltransferase involved in cell wall biosynthesis